MSERKKILINAYTISPYRGSEASVAWNHVKNMSQVYNLVVFYGCSGEYMGDNQDLPRWLESNKLENVEFVFVEPSKVSKFLTKLNKKGFIYAHYPAFKLWQKRVYKYAKEYLKRNNNVAMIHQLGPIGYREPGYLWKFVLPYMWGPIGGFNNAPQCLLPLLSRQGRIKHYIRSVTNWWAMNHGCRVRKAMNRANLVVGATSECADMIKKLYHKERIYVAENCIDREIGLNFDKFNANKFHIIFVGRIDANKAVILQIKALAKLKERNDWIFDIVGDGSERGALEKFCKQNDIEDKVCFHGFVKRNEAIELFKNAHLHIITSVSEGNPTTIWEAMSYGVPTLTLDHCGMRDTINENNGIKIQIADVETVVDEIADVINNFLNHPEKIKALGESTIQEAQNYTLEKRRKIISEFYERTITNFNKKQ